MIKRFHFTRAGLLTVALQLSLPFAANNYTFAQTPPQGDAASSIVESPVPYPFLSGYQNSGTTVSNAPFKLICSSHGLEWLHALGTSQSYKDTILDSVFYGSFNYRDNKTLDLVPELIEKDPDISFRDSSAFERLKRIRPDAARFGIFNPLVLYFPSDFSPAIPPFSSGYNIAASFDKPINMACTLKYRLVRKKTNVPFADKRGEPVYDLELTTSIQGSYVAVPFDSSLVRGDLPLALAKTFRNYDAYGDSKPIDAPADSETNANELAYQQQIQQLLSEKAALAQEAQVLRATVAALQAEEVVIPDPIVFAEKEASYQRQIQQLTTSNSLLTQEVAELTKQVTASKDAEQKAAIDQLSKLQVLAQEQVDQLQAELRSERSRRRLADRIVRTLRNLRGRR